MRYRVLKSYVYRFRLVEYDIVIVEIVREGVFDLL